MTDRFIPEQNIDVRHQFKHRVLENGTEKRSGEVESESPVVGRREPRHVEHDIGTDGQRKAL